MAFDVSKVLIELHVEIGLLDPQPRLERAGLFCRFRGQPRRYGLAGLLAEFRFLGRQLRASELVDIAGVVQCCLGGSLAIGQHTVDEPIQSRNLDHQRAPRLLLLFRAVGKMKPQRKRLILDCLRPFPREQRIEQVFAIRWLIIGSAAAIRSRRKGSKSVSRNRVA